ncbi:MAG: hypothetical protein KKB65_05535 [Nanoarchaeota archaeon]|nr:hypothetical protein [Nanoarchaeota archaeon]
MKFLKKGQAALEFLTTYGWAFLIILVMIGALAYFGVLSPERFVPERCKLSGEIDCNTFSLDTTNFNINLNNNLANTVNITGINLIDPKTNTRTTLSIIETKIRPYSNDNITSVHGLTTLDSGSKVRFNIEVVWFKTDAGSEFTRTATGDIVATVI